MVSGLGRGDRSRNMVDDRNDERDDREYNRDEYSRDDRGYERSERPPTFNVTEFQGVVNVQMNDAMRSLLIRLISELDSDDLEVELRAFRNALNHPQGVQTRKPNNWRTRRT